MGLLIQTSLFLAFAAGIYALWRAWRHRPQLGWTEREILVLAGWGLMAIGIAGFTLRGGDRGAAVAIAAIMLTALGLFSRNVWQALASSDHNTPRDGYSGSATESWRLHLQTMAGFMLAGPVAATSAMLITLSAMALLRMAAVSEANMIALGLILAPLLWAVGVAYTAIDDKLLRKTALVFFPGAFAAAHLVILK